MTRLTFVNLPIQSAAKTKAFYEALGFEFNPQFSSEDTLCMIVSETAYVMFLETDRFKGFVDKELADTRTTVAALLSFSCASKEEVVSTCEKAFELGARRYKEPDDHGFMLAWGFEDPDGHIVEPFWMNPEHLEA
ncbi:VOC family protein [Aquiluna sp. KACHI24]|uniref:VOC family protein n=1 Tax=Aquiluna sp. KACHI24 TaxID=2968831 RepID=UPI00220C1554|nr:VOC family protein [Aquiluna sp. KACHI24]BDQ00772.1 glyoxalase [Aquiluna sp. KACHI24]